MKKYLKYDEWCIIEEGFNPANHQASESIFSIGNGKMGQRANFEEKYSGESLQGSYVAGVYYPDKTRVGWWKNGYPEYFAKVLNSPNWIGINVTIDGFELDLYKCKVDNFTRTLNMKEGFLLREFEATLENDKKISVKAKRFVSMADTENGAIRYSITPINFSGKISFTPYIDGDIENEDSNYDEKFWNILDVQAEDGSAYLESQTKKSDFRCGFAMKYIVKLNEKVVKPNAEVIQLNKWVGNQIEIEVKEGETACIEKFAGVTSSLNYATDALKSQAEELASFACHKGFDKLFEDHKQKWSEKWIHSDIKIKGDIAAQQAIRFNIFHLNQTYTGEDERLNVGPKGFTGEKYGGTTYWDTEAYCIPFFLMTSPSQVTRQLLIYRYKHLPRAIENAEKLGFKNGAALYPMVTANGEECHNEWEITFEEIHRNGAIAFAIHNYIRHTGDKKYLEEYGLEVLVGISRFWSQRVTFSEARKKYVMLGVTGPNEYENNINNNWYTNKMATWCLKYTKESIDYVKAENPERYEELKAIMNFNEEETVRWMDIVDNMHFPYNEELKVFMQQDGFMDKEQMMADDLDPAERPINQHWSWDRILRSNFIKQADTLQGMYVLEEQFTEEEIRRNFDFYEPRTVHESSLSPCVHSVLASKIGKIEKAYEMYLRTSRLDLDDYNAEVHEGLHITSMAGTWMAIVEGFGGKRAYDEKLYLNPVIPEQWEEYAFRIRFKGKDLEVRVNENEIEIISHASLPVELFVYDKPVTVEENKSITISR
ncbi:family 65 glycosyl hydrolase domain-containing protein [Plebeiibacterium sediminum]|uniref:Family 65 glycosyl hydrolase domain-containing protein n=1 Tax=Plebeiibacterium sediminum TaxID=2992112 RepID=A0AAE3M2M2_9BACT|nr:family 65 glycosyl hydrolase domain-containing protein [Plebeiobacterium sediminum]MCW3785620.1 family 65 glycosyl hydrolase domain-containing protein [Plebeiobacterium sediminum]